MGIDLSQVQIDQGRRIVQELGLRNLELLQGDIATTDLPALGQFDYIICHGVYSWVPANVQEAILAAFHTLLAPRGVAYISYNVYPGWKAKEIVRDAMMLRGGDRRTPQRKTQLRARHDRLSRGGRPGRQRIGQGAGRFQGRRQQRQGLLRAPRAPGDFNTPCYFLEFGKRAEPYRLAYLGDALRI